MFVGHTEIANHLLQKGAKVNVKDKFGLTPLMVAAAKGFIDLIKERMNEHVVIDGRNLWSRKALEDFGFYYDGIGT